MNLTPASSVKAPVAIISGATGGIGLQIAASLADAGFRSALVGRDQASGTAAAERIGASAHFIQADLTKHGAPEFVVSEAVRAFGRVDVLVNNAGQRLGIDLVDLTVEDLTAAFALNATAPILLAGTVARQLIAQGTGGSIVNISSRLASVGLAGVSGYSASKGAIESFTRAAAVELAPHGIRVNAVAPGITKTAMLDGWAQQQDDPSEFVKGLSSTIPLGRLAEPDDIARAVRYFATDESSYITGQTLLVDGGYTIA